MAHVKDRTGQRFSRLTVIERDFSKNKGKIYWLCKCDCGNIKSIAACHLLPGGTMSCGCQKSEAIRLTKTAHDLSKLPEYKTWLHIKKRCYNPNEENYIKYGFLGITVCPEWLYDFRAFYEHIGPRPSKDHSVDRINNFWGYIPGNVRWATLTEQANNKRSNKTITYMGKTMNQCQWAEETGIKRETIAFRLRNEWPLDDVFNPADRRILLR